MSLLCNKCGLISCHCDFGLSEKQAIAYLKYWEKNRKHDPAPVIEPDKPRGFVDLVVDKIDGFINVLIDAVKKK